MYEGSEFAKSKNTKLINIDSFLDFFLNLSRLIMIIIWFLLLQRKISKTFEIMGNANLLQQDIAKGNHC